MRTLLDQLESTTERGVKTREQLFAQIKGELMVHEAIEEEIFYPELKSHPRAKDIVLEGFQEHHVVDLLMGELEALPVDDETWGAKAIVMKENVEHHMEEEEGEMFTKAEQVFDAAELADLGGGWRNASRPRPPRSASRCGPDDRVTWDPGGATMSEEERRKDEPDLDPGAYIGREPELEAETIPGGVTGRTSASRPTTRGRAWTRRPRIRTSVGPSETEPSGT